MSLMAQLGPPEASSASTAMVKEFTRELDAATSYDTTKKSGIRGCASETLVLV